MNNAEISGYAAALKFLYGLQFFGANFGLKNTFRLAAAVGNPQAKLRFIHIAGTNGKGSTCAMLEGIYRAAGLRVGLFTSPHLVSFRERIQIDRQLISETEIVRLVEELRRANQGNETTLFEFATVMALQHFAEQKCDLVIWETGLGGRLDATNIVTPLASVITNIAFDHQQWLGDTLEKIAAEKAGIIKPGVPVVTATDEPEALRVIETVAKEKGSPLTCVENIAAARIPHPPALLGEHQQWNAALARATVEALQPQIPVSAEQIQSGLATVKWPGRLQLIQATVGRSILLDGAHNLAGAKALRAALEQTFPSRRCTLIFGALADKDWQPICGLLAPLAQKILTVPVASERTADPRALAETFRQANPTAQIFVHYQLETALKQTASDEFTVITGSLYLVGEALQTLGFSPANPDERRLNEWSAPAANG